jgi:molecular chaperone DnaJ
MNISEAYKLLEIDQSCSDDELKSQYKSLAKKYHPDIYKEDPNKFKEINSAYQMITDYRENPHKNNSFGPFSGGFSSSPFNININDIFSSFIDQEVSQQVHHKPPMINVSLSFKEAVLGAQKKISYKRYMKCNDCNGKGLDRKPNSCDQCDGFGRVIKIQGNMHFSSSCSKCRGRDVKTNKCNGCNGKACNLADAEETINIPPGINGNAILRAPNVGHFAGTSPFGGDQYAHADINVKVEKDPSLSLEERDVILKLKVPLLDVLTGVEKEVPTIHGEKKIKIQPLSKNKDVLIIRDCGVPAAQGYKAGVQKVILDVEYPKDATKLIAALKEELN